MLRKLAPFVLSLSMASSAQAQPQPVDDVARARELFVEGATLAEAGRWAEARERFARSVELKRAALTLYNLGIAQQETGRIADALESFRAFLAQPVEPATQVYVAPVRDVVKKLEARVVQLAIDVRPAGLRGLVVRLDGRQVTAAGPIVVDPGPHEVVAVAPGYGEVRQKSSFAGGRASIAITFPLQPAPTHVGLPAALGLGLGGLGLAAGGEVLFGLGVQKSIATPSRAGSARAMMVAGNVIAVAGAIAAGAGLVLLVKRPTAAAPTTAAVRLSGAGVPELALTF